ncbi:MAG: flavin reductase family protein [Acidobacteria bacterium]|nr:flavin reductase family protein [Acidobacteriota bacterium]MBK8150977.1 flavin reductase family protein [Acidobacteriota bacterium]MBK8812812.1 flavin reductase family protein [Acidobacteriota bacterium]
MAVSNQEFRAALGRFASGVTVVTTRDHKGDLHGITVSAFSSVSMNPPLVLICIERTTGSHHAFVESGRFTVNILSAEQSGVSDRFAFRHEDKFSGIGFRIGEQGIPIIEGCLANLECRVVNEYSGGDHTIFVGEVEAVHTDDKSPLIYWTGEYRTIA